MSLRISQSFNQDTNNIMPVCSCMCKTIIFNTAPGCWNEDTGLCILLMRNHDVLSWIFPLHTHHCVYRLLKLINNSQALNSLPMQNNNWWWCKHIAIIIYNVQCSIIIIVAVVMSSLKVKHATPTRSLAIAIIH